MCRCCDSIWWHSLCAYHTLGLKKRVTALMGVRSNTEWRHEKCGWLVGGARKICAENKDRSVPNHKWLARANALVCPFIFMGKPSTPENWYHQSVCVFVFHNVHMWCRTIAPQERTPIHSSSVYLNIKLLSSFGIYVALGGVEIMKRFNIIHNI